MISAKELLKDLQLHHSTLQMDSFITVREGKTLYGCYRQALRELNTRINSVEDMEWELEKLRFEASSGRTLAGVLLHELEVKRHQQIIERMGQDLWEIRNEQNRFFSQAVALRNLLIAQGFSFPLSQKDRDQLDREMWIANIKSRAAVEVMTSGRLSPPTIELLSVVPKEMREDLRIVMEEGQRPRLLEWYWSHEPALALEPPPNHNIA